MIDPNLLRDMSAFADALRAIHEAKATGAVTIHFAQGQAVRLELAQVPLFFRLDTGKKLAQGKREH